MNKTFYSRKIYPELKEHLNSRQVTVITGMRRVGKTTLVEKLLSEIEGGNKIFFDLQKVSNQELFSQKNYDNVISEIKGRGLEINRKIYLAIDEIQLLPGVAGVIKYLYDHYDIKFIVTGSSSYYLKNLFTESLAGRKKIFELYPLDFGEFLDFKETPYDRNADFLEGIFSASEYERLGFLYEEYIKFGGFPEVVLAKTEKERKDILEDIVSSYINIDIKALSDFREGSNVYNLLKMLASRVANKLDYSKISQLTGLSRTTVFNYVDLFEKTYLLRRVPVYTNSPDREIVKAKKLYFSDTGFLLILADVNGGSRFENAIFSQLRNKGEIRYYSLKTGREIDFILDKKYSLEVKENPTEKDEKELKNLSETARLERYHLIGRYQSANFSNYIWGGDIK